MTAVGVTTLVKTNALQCDFHGSYSY
jgi:hypothetical protein